MEHEPVRPQEGIRPRTLTWLCIASFVNQALVFPIYFFGILAAYLLREWTVEEIKQVMETSYGPLFRWLGEDGLTAHAALFKAKGTPLMVVLALRTLVRFVGTLRMWQGFKDGFHIYTMAQLLGVLLPIVVAGTMFFNFIGFILALNWCYLYFIHRNILRVPSLPPDLKNDPW